MLKGHIAGIKLDYPKQLQLSCCISDNTSVQLHMQMLTTIPGRFQKLCLVSKILSHFRL